MAMVGPRPLLTSSPSDDPSWPEVVGLVRLASIVAVQHIHYHHHLHHHYHYIEQPILPRNSDHGDGGGGGHGSRARETQTVTETQRKIEK